MNKKFRAYIELMRLERPVGTLLLLWPTIGSLWISANSVPNLSLIAIFTAGTFIMRSAGCVINDYADRELDGLVKRTKSRPLVDGRISPRKALIVFSILSGMGGSLLLFLNSFTKWIAILGLLLTLIYPYMKRHTYLPQLVLGLAFSWGILMAATASIEHISFSIWIYFLANFVWIVSYDTIYAIVDRNDDLVAGIKSTAILFSGRDRHIIGILQGAFIGLLLWLGYLENFQHAYYIAIGVVIVLFINQQFLIRNHDRLESFKAFRNNTWVGFAIFVGIITEISLRGISSEL